MIRRLIAVGLLCALAACAVTQPDCPREGGIGGTGGCSAGQENSS